MNEMTRSGATGTEAEMEFSAEALAQRARRDAVRELHALLGVVEEVVRQLGLPHLVGVGFEAARAHEDQVHVQHGDLRPGAESREEVEVCRGRIAVNKERKAA